MTRFWLLLAGVLLIVGLVSGSVAIADPLVNPDEPAAPLQQDEDPGQGRQEHQAQGRAGHQPQDKDQRGTELQPGGDQSSPTSVPVGPDSPQGGSSAGQSIATPENWPQGGLDSRPTMAPVDEGPRQNSPAVGPLGPAGATAAPDNRQTGQVKPPEGTPATGSTPGGSSDGGSRQSDGGPRGTTPGDPPADGTIPPNFGTIKVRDIDLFPALPGPSNIPWLRSCNFFVQGYAENSGVVRLRFFAWPPTGNMQQVLVKDITIRQPTGKPSENGIDFNVPVSSQELAAGGGQFTFTQGPLPELGPYGHFRVDAEDAEGRHLKTKVFWAPLCAVATPTPSPTPGPSPTPTQTSTPGPSPTPTQTSTPGPSPTPTQTSTPGPSPTPTQTAIPGPSPTPTSPPAAPGAAVAGVAPPPAAPPVVTPPAAVAPVVVPPAEVPPAEVAPAIPEEVEVLPLAGGPPIPPEMLTIAVGALLAGIGSLLSRLLPR